jgi:YggT family protein
VNGLLCYATEILNYLLTIFTIALFVYAVASWFPGLRGRWLYYLARFIEPVLAPVRRIIPPIGGLDVAFLVVLLILQLVIRPLIGSALLNTCRPF